MSADTYSRMFGLLDWINRHLFRGRITWPCWLLDWAWDRQATPYVPAERTQPAERQHTIDGPHYDTVGHNPSLCHWDIPHCGPCWIRGEPMPANPWKAARDA